MTPIPPKEGPASILSACNCGTEILGGVFAVEQIRYQPSLVLLAQRKRKIVGSALLGRAVISEGLLLRDGTGTDSRLLYVVVGGRWGL